MKTRIILQTEKNGLIGIRCRFSIQDEKKEKYIFYIEKNVESRHVFDAKTEKSGRKRKTFFWLSQ